MNLSMDEDRALIDADLVLDMNAFRDLVKVVSIDPIRRIEKEKLLLHELTNEAETTGVGLGPCECELLLRFSLPCSTTFFKPAKAAHRFPVALKVLRFAAMRGSRHLRAQEKAKAIAERHDDLSHMPIGNTKMLFLRRPGVRRKTMAKRMPGTDCRRGE